MQSSKSGQRVGSEGGVHGNGEGVREVCMGMGMGVREVCMGMGMVVREVCMGMGMGVGRCAWEWGW